MRRFCSDNRDRLSVHFFNYLSLSNCAEFFGSFKCAADVCILGVAIEREDLAAVWAIQLIAVANLVGFLPEDLLAGRAPDLDSVVHGRRALMFAAPPH